MRPGFPKETAKKKAKKLSNSTSQRKGVSLFLKEKNFTEMRAVFGSLKRGRHHYDQGPGWG